jgi:recombination associated protein RdgC
MPALKGSLTYARYFVSGEVPKDFRERFMRAIRLRAMKPLEAEDDAAERSGWCAIGEPFDVDLHYDGVFYNSYVNLGFRTDRWVIPGPLLRARMREAEQAYLLKRGRERLSKSEKAELKEVVSRKLRKQFVPVTRAVDLSWGLEDGVVRFFSQSPRTGANMLALFQKTFGLELAPEAPYTLAARLGLEAREERAWEGLEPTQLARAERSERRQEN